MAADAGAVVCPDAAVSASYPPASFLSPASSVVSTPSDRALSSLTSLAKARIICWHKHWFNPVTSRLKKALRKLVSFVE